MYTELACQGVFFIVNYIVRGVHVHVRGTAVSFSAAAASAAATSAASAANSFSKTAQKVRRRRQSYTMRTLSVISTRKLGQTRNFRVGGH